MKNEFSIIILNNLMKRLKRFSHFANFLISDTTFVVEIRKIDFEYCSILVLI